MSQNGRYCEHCNREDHLMPILGRVRNIDACIAHIVAALNAGNIPTVASCCGHGKGCGNIILQDGRELFIAPDFATGRQWDTLLKR